MYVDKRIWGVYEMEGLKAEAMKAFDAARVILNRAVFWTTVGEEIMNYMLLYSVRLPQRSSPRIFITVS